MPLQLDHCPWPVQLGEQCLERTIPHAAAVSREDIDRGVAELATIPALAGTDLVAHIQRCIDALRADASRLGL